MDDVAWWGWIIVGAVFLLIELMTTTFFGLWMAIAALVPAAISFIKPELPLGWQISVWIVSMLACAFIWVRVSKRTTPNTPVEGSIIGQIGVLSRGCSPDVPGALLLQKPVEGLTEWTCFSDEMILPNSRVVVSEKISRGTVRVAISKISVSE